ncbi:MAG: DUF3108 domain-containing protein [candidate division NC10 bacterium]|nr:DUF3108 domain-containing protein [candidate division NC10 bacterium]
MAWPAWWWSVLLCLLLVPASALAADARRAMAEGERLFYDITWLGIKGGDATMEARGIVRLNGQAAYHIVTTAKSSPFVSKFYRIEDRSDSYLTVDAPRSLQFEKHLREGNYRHDSWTVFDHEAQVARFRYLDFSLVPKGVKRLEEAEKLGKYVRQEFPLAAGALDELCVLYYVRNIPLSVGKTVHAKVFASKKNWELEVKVLGRETLETVLGRRDTLVVEPLLKFEGIFQRKGRLIVWMTDDALRVPVLTKSEIKIGSFMATLTRRVTGAAAVPPAAAEPGK